LKAHHLPRDKKENKLTQLLSTHGQFMSFGMYELWGLIDDCHFIIDDIETVIRFTKHCRIGPFVNHFFQKRVAATTKGENALCKNLLNSSYGSDGQNNEKFNDIKFMTEKKANKATCSNRFKSMSKITHDLYLVEREQLTARCPKPLQSSYATLSNAKYWYISFVYKFMYRCLDRERFHFVAGDTDSYFWAVAGDASRGPEQHFEAIVKDREFYDTNYELWFPAKKTLLTLEYEHCGYDAIALAPKNYWINDRVKPEVKLKGVSTRGNLNQHIDGAAFEKCLTTRELLGAENFVLRTKDHVMTNSWPGRLDYRVL
jgi:hypothetical protein